MLVRLPLPPFDRLAGVDRSLLFGPPSRMFWLKLVVVPAFCLGLIMSPRLWIGPRSYPLAPVFDRLPSASPIVDYSMSAGLLGVAVAILLAPRPRKLITAFLAILVALCLFDQTRWQPWVFFYGALLGVLASYSWEKEDLAGRDCALNIARLIVAGTYLFSGLQKVNPNFFRDDFP